MTEQPNADRIEPFSRLPTPIRDAVIDFRKAVWNAGHSAAKHPDCDCYDGHRERDALDRLLVAALTPDPVTLKEVEGLVDAFGEAAQTWGWESDQGTRDAPAKAHTAFANARAALIAAITPFLTRSAGKALKREGIFEGFVSAFEYLFRDLPWHDDERLKSLIGPEFNELRSAYQRAKYFSKDRICPTPPQTEAVERQRVPEHPTELALIDSLQAAAWTAGNEELRKDTDCALTDAEREARAAIEERFATLRSLISTSPAVANGGWQDISTAPKDGTKILFYAADMGLTGPGEAMWSTYRWWAFGAMGGMECHPTHWRPLPAPPQQQPATPGQDGEGR